MALADQEVVAILQNVREAVRAHRRLSRGVISEAVADAVVQRLRAVIDTSSLAMNVDQLVASARASPRNSLRPTREALDVETRLIRSTGIGRGVITARLRRALDSGAVENGAYPRLREIADVVVASHERAKADVHSSRALSRVAKKCRKKRATAAVHLALLGLGVTVSNVPRPDLFPLSYAIARGALREAANS